MVPLRKRKTGDRTTRTTFGYTISGHAISARLNCGPVTGTLSLRCEGADHNSNAFLFFQVDPIKGILPYTKSNTQKFGLSNKVKPTYRKDLRKSLTLTLTLKTNYRKDLRKALKAAEEILNEDPRGLAAELPPEVPEGSVLPTDNRNSQGEGDMDGLEALGAELADDDGEWEGEF